jgi:dienelactone hydrolase
MPAITLPAVFLRFALTALPALLPLAALARTERMVEIPTRPGITQRLLVLAPGNPRAAVILFTGGDGFLGISPEGKLQRGGNFLVRSRQLFSDSGLVTVVVDSPSDRQSPPYLSGYRQTAEHVADIRAVTAWLREQHKLPVWLIGTSRGTQSVGYAATQLAPAEGGADGIVLTASIVRDPRSRPVTDMALDRIRIPVLVAHHRQDGCRLCLFQDVPAMFGRLTAAPRKELLAFDGGLNVGDPCEARAYHGFNGIEREVVSAISAWITAR